ncbi:MAG: hypothetical protein V4692_13105, partial [Bdellovibrionota bacterium]
LLAAKDFNPSLASGVIATVLTADVATFVSPSLDTKLLELDSEFEEHAGRDQYMSDQKHITANDLFDFYDEVLQKWGVLAGLFLLLQAKLASFFAKREEKFQVSDYLKKVIAIEVRYSEYRSKHGGSPANWHELDTEISLIKHEVMHHYMNGKLDDIDSLPHFLSVVASAHHRLSGDPAGKVAPQQKSA